MREADIEKHLVKAIEAARGVARKLKWIGRRSAPDRLIILNGQVVFVEVKAPGETPDMAQILEHRRLREAGALVFVIDSKAEADWLVREFSLG